MVRLIILLLFCLSANAQVSRSADTLRIHDDKYVMVGDMLTYYSSRSNYNTIVNGPLATDPYLESFVRDALIYEREIDGISPLTYQHGPGQVTTGITIADNETWTCTGCRYGEYTYTRCAAEERTWNPDALPYPRFEYQCIRYETVTVPAAPSNRLPAGTSTGRIGDRGYNVRIRAPWWNNQYLRASTRIFVMYHELGHAMLELNHECDPNKIMWTSAIQNCAEIDFTKSIFDSVHELFTTRGTPIPNSGLSGKGNSIVTEIDD